MLTLIPITATVLPFCGSTAADLNATNTSTTSVSTEDVRFSNPYTFLARDKDVIEEAYPGDVVGLVRYRVT